MYRVLIEYDNGDAKIEMLCVRVVFCCIDNKVVLNAYYSNDEKEEFCFNDVTTINYYKLKD